MALSMLECGQIWDSEVLNKRKYLTSSFLYGYGLIFTADVMSRHTQRRKREDFRVNYKKSFLTTYMLLLLVNFKFSSSQIFFLLISIDVESSNFIVHNMKCIL